MNQIDFKSIAKVRCGDENGTGFLVNETTLITARHVIEDNLDPNELEPVFIMFEDNAEIQATVIFPNEPDVGADFAILSLPEGGAYSPTLPISIERLELNEKWEAFGFPFTQKDRGQPFHGTILQVFDEREECDFDLDLACEIPKITDPKFITRGASGSPIVVNGGIVGVMKDKASGGGMIGATSINRCLPILRSLNISVNILDIGYGKIESSSANFVDGETIFKSNYDSEKEIVMALIEDFPPETHSILMESLIRSIESIMKTDNEKLRAFFQSYRHPFEVLSNVSGIEQLLEIVTILRCGYRDISFIHNDINANLSLDENEEIFAYLIFSTKRNAKMPELLLGLFRKKEATATGKRELRRGESMFPFPLILDNCSKSKKTNLCKRCQNEFSFEDILIDFTKVNEQGYFKGLEENNYKSLDGTKVLCGDCIRTLYNHVTNPEELEFHIREMNKID
ncbi:ABC-three component system protein [Paenibacillus amylolyticus]|uniref:ABC-three component system protein n=1 Tax=Paenibacillus amylolyticus TaxID=1451 RepID=UPI000FDBC4F1|nr:ABC-three component system protein [Paenibacillus amylolyticus]